MNKTCCHCKNTLPSFNFSNNSKTKDKLEKACRSCRKEFQGRYRSKNREALREESKKYYLQHKTQALKRCQVNRQRKRASCIVCLKRSPTLKFMVELETISGKSKMIFKCPNC